MSNNTRAFTLFPIRFASSVSLNAANNEDTISDRTRLRLTHTSSPPPQEQTQTSSSPPAYDYDTSTSPSLTVLATVAVISILFPRVTASCMVLALLVLLFWVIGSTWQEVSDGEVEGVVFGEERDRSGMFFVMNGFCMFLAAVGARVVERFLLG
ncbi:uncharacterized protein EI97DRAFT_459386 [Westerdykella ornata]|uniref:Uncharacterized protein n=1 Tax=Westerdykella ornata TaxID=318751 RepID=A0A6A6JIL2_WESOR|nr:uncharacterized protein EI97DRAFT_459386 [Westerdykella ornata]KAF2275486.1 hypothetical protein EI97DRAFT_459386 [Westerdykella ornata]